MSPRLAIAAGLVAGVVAAAALLALVVAIGPDPGAARETVPPVVPSPAASPAIPGGSPGGSPAGSPAATPGATTFGATASGAAAFHVGQPAPPLRVPQLGGGTIDLSLLRGRPVWINFMATWCPSCADDFPVMNRFSARHADDGLVVVAVDVEEDEAAVAALVQTLDPIFPMGLDRDGSVADAWDAVALPVHFWVDGQGIVRDGAFGGIGPDLMAAALGRIMPGVDVSP